MGMLKLSRRIRQHRLVAGALGRRRQNKTGARKKRVGSAWAGLVHAGNLHQNTKPVSCVAARGVKIQRPIPTVHSLSLLGREHTHAAVNAWASGRHVKMRM
jgi:hypothetical protein